MEQGKVETTEFVWSRIDGRQQGFPTDAESLRRLAGREGEVHGMVHRIRRMSGFSFLIVRCARDLIQCVAGDETEGMEGLVEGMAVRVQGTVRIEARNAAGVELDATRVQVLSGPDREWPFVLNKKELNIALDTNLDHRSVALRHPRERAVFRIQNALVAGFRQYLDGQRFTEIRSPKLVFAGAEGGSNIFRVDWFGRDAFLAQSPQFYKQAMVGVFERVYEIGAVYRAEPHATSRHLNEYIGLDVEMGFINGFEDLMELEAALLRHMFDHVKESAAEELSLLHADIPNIGSIPAISFVEAKRLAEKRLGRADHERNDLSPDEENAVCGTVREAGGGDFVFVTHYPEPKRPFYAMEDPADRSRTLSFDLLFRGLEVTTGGRRIHDAAAQIEKLRSRGMDEAAFESYLMIHHAGMPPHGGFGAGLERLTMKLLNLPNIRQASLYPRDMNRLVP